MSGKGRRPPRSRLARHIRAFYRRANLMTGYTRYRKQGFLESLREFLGPCLWVLQALQIHRRHTQARILTLVCVFLLFSMIILSDHQKMAPTPPATLQYNSWLTRNFLGSLAYWKGEVGKTTISQPSPFPVYTPNCDTLMDGDPEEIYVTQEMLYKESVTALSDAQMATQAKDCLTFQASEGYLQAQPTSVELQFPIAYIITVHKTAQQVNRLLRAIYSPQNAYCIHISRQSSNQFHLAVQEIAKCLPNVFIASRLEAVVLGEFSRLQAEINCLGDLLNSTVRWKYAINLDGQDFPLKTNLEIVNQLTSWKDINDIPGIIAPEKLLHDHMKHTHTVIMNESRRLIQHTDKVILRPPYNLPILLGASHNIFSRKFIEFVSLSNVAKDLLQWVKHFQSPEKIFWATLNHMSEAPGGRSKPLSHRIIQSPDSPSSTRQIPLCQGYYHTHTCIHTVADLKWLAHQNFLFAGLFDLDVDHVVLQCLDQKLHMAVEDERHQSVLASKLLNKTYKYSKRSASTT